MTIPKLEAVDGPGFDAESCLLAEQVGLELLAEIPVVTPTDLGALETMVCRAIEVLSILICTGITVFCLSQLENDGKVETPRRVCDSRPSIGHLLIAPSDPVWVTHKMAACGSDVWQTGPLMESP